MAVYDEIGDGGAVGGGSAPSFAEVMTGGGVGGGEALVSLVQSEVADGGAVGGGSAPSFAEFMTGGGVGGGTAIVRKRMFETATGGGVGAGDGTVKGTYNITARGGARGGGSAVVTCVYTLTASGGGVGNGGHKDKFRYVADTSTPITIGGGASYRSRLSFPLPLRWNNRALVTTGRTFRWDVGTQPMRWFRVQGCCRYPTASGDGMGEDGGPLNQPGGCDVLPIQTQDGKCKGAIGKNNFFQNIAAESLTGVCEYLKEMKWRWPICSIQKFTRPADNRFVDPSDDCNKLEDVEFCDIPECFDFCLHTDGVVKMGMGTKANQNIIRYEGSGGLSVSGAATAEVVSSGTTGYDYSYQMKGGISIGGSADYRVVYDTGYGVDMGFGASLDDLEIVYSPQDDAPLLTATTDTVATECGNCKQLPQVLQLTHNLANAAVFREFCVRNGITVPQTIPLHHSYRSGTWQGSLHYSGISDTNQSSQEMWRLVFEWGCVNALASEELGARIWKFSMSVLRRNLDTGLDFDTRLLIAFPPEQICADVQSFDFSFRFDTQKIFVKTDLDIVVDVRLLYDNVGAFRSAFWKTNLLKFNVSATAAEENFERQDIKPIFPEERVLLPV